MPLPLQLTQISDAIWEIPTSFKPGMLVPARIFATEALLNQMDYGVFEQICNVAMLPGIVKFAFCMPDAHLGYGFPIGGVAPIDSETGVISPGGIGFDINCGMRLVKTNLFFKEIKDFIPQIIDRLYRAIPSGVAGFGSVQFTRAEFEQITLRGAAWCVEHGYGDEQDLQRTEEMGCIKGADINKVSERAITRGYRQVGTLGSGNHYLEIQFIKADHIYDKERASIYGVADPDQIVITFHCGSRGFGHQVATDYLQRFLAVMTTKYGISLPDRELACAPFHSPEGQDYFAAMKCAANVAFANRQMILYQIRRTFKEVLGLLDNDLQINQVYDIAHNMAKLERYQIDGVEKDLIVHRKGATRAFGPQMKGVPEEFKSAGQPVIIGGSMESGSYLLSGIQSGVNSFFSTTHGSGRVLSRRAARQLFDGKELQLQMRHRGIYTRTASYKGFAEEAGAAYKNVDQVIEAAYMSGTCKPVVKFTPVGNIKG